ncbi:uncharacterized protein LOC111477692 [Cucurbita maxima]|uniref:Uncharacterized protein LOC111477692 n=1 Tax=Cucurbita maxima TaxID=3661 RepID=A0A6J1IJM3_CUCMA|nr:uncharacterized protein LOC111477692 [Cucurbita maxima]
MESSSVGVWWWDRAALSAMARNSPALSHFAILLKSFNLSRRLNFLGEEPVRFQVEMGGSRSDDISGATYSPRSSGRPIPKRGQVKLGIMVGLAHSVASIFSPTTRPAAAHRLSRPARPAFCYSNGRERPDFGLFCKNQEFFFFFF